MHVRGRKYETLGANRISRLDSDKEEVLVRPPAIRIKKVPSPLEKCDTSRQSINGGRLQAGESPNKLMESPLNSSKNHPQTIT